MNPAHNKIRAILVNGNHLPSLGVALDTHLRFIYERLEAGKSLSKFVDSKAQDEYFESWGRSRDAVEDLLTQVRAHQWQMDDEAKNEPDYLSTHS